MKRFKFNFIVLLVTALFSFSSFAAGGKLIEVLLNDSGMIELLSKRGIQNAPAKKVAEYVGHSLVSLSYTNKKPTAQSLKKVLKGLSGTRDDITYRKELLELLDKPADSLSKDDIVKAVNNLVYLANRYGSSGATVLACADCVSEALAKNGFKFTLEVLNDKSSQRVLTKILPRKPRDLTNFINAEMARGGLGNFSQSASKSGLVSPEEERALGLFLGLRKFGSPKQKDLIEAIISVSKDRGGKTLLLSEDNPHQLWKLFSEDMSDTVMDSWTKMLREVAQNSDGTEGSAKKSFYSYLEGLAGDDEVLKEQLDALKRKNCFFK